MGFEPTTFCMASSADDHDVGRRSTTMACKWRHSAAFEEGRFPFQRGSPPGRLGQDWATNSMSGGPPRAHPYAQSSDPPRCD